MVELVKDAWMGDLYEHIELAGDELDIQEKRNE
jgi:hypothetical protein